jgi:hypothetical protein
MPEVLTAAEMLTNAAERESAWVFLAPITRRRFSIADILLPYPIEDGGNIAPLSR